MRNQKWLRAAFTGLSIQSAFATDPTVTFEKSQVTYRGTQKGSVEDFHNIKFAHDTSGKNRFAPPRPYTPSEGSVIDATVPGPACPQLKAGIPPFFSETPDQSEDCLTLRITRPAGISSQEKLPVVVHIPGGGVIKGSTYDEIYNPTNLVTRSVELGEPVIHVILNYRLTIFGFARLPLLKDQQSLNAGVRDQRAGLQWVKDNIAEFGGDPERITSFGLSSGGTFTSLHLMTYGGEKGVPFTQAWVMSGPPGTALNISSTATEIHTYAVAEKLGCKGEDGDNNDDEAILECLREVPMDKLTETAMDYSIANHPPAGLFTFIPSIDDDLIPDRQSTLYKAGKFVKNIPIVFGWTQDDGATNAGPAPMFQTEEDMKTPIKNFAHALTDEDYEKLFSLYPASSFEEEVRYYEARKAESDPAAPVHYFRIARIMRDLLFTCSSIDFGYEMARQSSSGDGSFKNVYHYMLNQSMVTPLFRAAGMSWLGPVHGSDLDYLYNNVFPRDTLSKEDSRFSETFLRSFFNFAHTGSPSGDGEWHASFTGLEQQRLATESELAGPEKLNVQVLGGPTGSGSTSVLKKSPRAAGQEEGSMQIPLGGENVEYGEMESECLGACRDRKRELDRENLLERCAFINTLAEKLGH